MRMNASSSPSRCSPWDSISSLTAPPLCMLHPVFVILLKDSAHLNTRVTFGFIATTRAHTRAMLPSHTRARTRAWTCYSTRRLTHAN
jgi:hypothetical protein